MNQSSAGFEVARFIQSIGPNAILRQFKRVKQKYDQLEYSRYLYADKFEIHTGISRIIRRMQFHAEPDFSDRLQIRALSFISAVNSAMDKLDEMQRERLRSIVISDMSPDRDLRALEHEMRCFVHFTLGGFDMQFADLRGYRFDFIARKGDVEFEIECKMFSEFTGLGYNIEYIANFVETIFAKDRIISKYAPDRDILIDIDYDSFSQAAKNMIISNFRNFLTSKYTHKCAQINFSLGDTLKNKLERHELKEEEISEDGSVIAMRKMDGDHRLVLRFKTSKIPAVAERLIRTIKGAADQLSGTRPGMCWIHLQGIDEAQFHALEADLAADPRQGLHAIASAAIHSNNDYQKRAHVSVIRYSVSTTTISRAPALGADRILTSAVSIDGPFYDAVNPRCRYRLDLTA